MKSEWKVTCNRIGGKMKFQPEAARLYPTLILKNSMMLL